MINTKTSIQSLCILFTLFVLCACKNQASDHPEMRMALTTTTVPFHERQISDFDFLEKGISYEEVVTRVGKEDKDIGSGLYILEYNLANGSRVYLHFITLKCLEKAYIVHSNGQIESIIEP